MFQNQTEADTLPTVVAVSGTYPTHDVDEDDVTIPVLPDVYVAELDAWVDDIDPKDLIEDN